MTIEYQTEHERLLDEILAASWNLSEAANKSQQQVQALVQQLDRLEKQRQVAAGQHGTAEHNAEATPTTVIDGG